MWALIGVQPVVPSAGQNRRVPVFGSLNPITGRLSVDLPGRKNSEAFLSHLKTLRKTYPGRHIILFTDNCSIHHAKKVARYLAYNRDHFTAIFNAAYTPELNLIERYWGHLKSKATNNYFFGTVDELATAIRDAVRDFNRSRTLRMNCYRNSCKHFEKALRTIIRRPKTSTSLQRHIEILHSLRTTSIHSDRCMMSSGSKWTLLEQPDPQ